MPTKIDIAPNEIEYPDSDGLPLAEIKEHLVWILKLFQGLEALFRRDSTVFVGSDMFWYPVEGSPGIRTAPDVMVVFDRTKELRRSYRQWEEGGTAPHVIIEFRSPGNTDDHMDELFQFYQTYGVEEYYVYDLSQHLLEGWRRIRGRFSRIRKLNNYISPRLGVRFDTSGDEWVIYNPDGSHFLDTIQNADHLEEISEQLAEQRQEAEHERKRAELAKRRADQQREKAEEEKKRADDEQRKREELIAKLKAMGIDPDSL